MKVAGEEKEEEGKKRAREGEEGLEQQKEEEGQKKEEEGKKEGGREEVVWAVLQHVVAGGLSRELFWEVIAMMKPRWVEGGREGGRKGGV